MTNRYRALLAFALLPLAIAGCSEDYEFTAPNPSFEVSPVFTSIDEGTSVQLEATDASGNPVSVTWTSDDTDIVTVNASGLAFGATPGVTAVIASNGSETHSASITVNQLQGIGLTRGVPVTGLSGAVGTTKLYRIFVPAGSTSLTISLSGGSGDADLYVNRGSPPTADVWACRPFLGGNNETCTINNPQSGTWYAWIDVFEDYAGASLVANYTP